MVKRIYEKGEVVEYRKIFKSGGSFVISIPKRWLEQNNITLGEELECRIKSNKIVILNKKWKKKK